MGAIMQMKVWLVLPRIALPSLEPCSHEELPNLYCTRLLWVEVLRQKRSVVRKCCVLHCNIKDS